MKRNMGRHVVLGLAPIAAAVLVAGCGKHESDSVALQASADQNVTATQTATTSVAAPSASSDVPATETRSGGDALPPEIEASAEQEQVPPGEIVEITAHGSADVVRMMLQDRLGQKEPFAYDSGAKVWRASYRVPLQPTVERVALSVTAENGSNHWRRVWVFVRTQPDSVSAPADSAAAQ